MEQSNASVKERVEHLESMLAQSEEKHKQQLNTAEAMRSQHMQLTLQAKQRDASHSSTAERLKHLEEMLEESGDKGLRQVRDAEAKLEKMHVRMAAHDAAIDALKRACAGLTSEKWTREMQQSSIAELMERINYVESTVGESVDKHTKDIT